MSALKSGLKWLGYILGGIVLYALAQVYPTIGYILGAAWAAYILHVIVKEAVREVLWEELRAARAQIAANREDIQAIDRKVSAVWERIRAIGGG